MKRRDLLISAAGAAFASVASGLSSHNAFAQDLSDKDAFAALRLTLGSLPSSPVLSRPHGAPKPLPSSRLL